MGSMRRQEASENEIKSIEDIKNIIRHKDFLQGTLLSYYEGRYEDGMENIGTDMVRFMKYKLKYAPYTAKLDCDSTIWSVVLYSLLYGLNKDKYHIRKQCYRKYELVCKEDNYIYRGDTLTSGWTPLKKYISMLWHRDDVAKEFKKLFEEKNTRDGIGIPDNKRTGSSYSFQKYVYDNRKIIASELGEGCKEFLNHIFDCGNYICIPAGKYSFNTGRSNFGTWDTVDRFLWKIYQYFINGREKKYLCQMVTHHKEEIAQDILKWFADFGIASWDDFVRVHCMQDHVREIEKNDEITYGAPISLKLSHMQDGILKCIYIDDILNLTLDYEPVPAGGEFENFFETARHLIGKRTERIERKVRIK